MDIPKILSRKLEIIIKHGVLVLALLLVTFAVYLQTLGHEFLNNWDDFEYVVNNPAIRGVTLKNLYAAFTGIFMGNYAPLHIVSYMFDYSIWGMRPSGYLLTNLILHAANGILFYALLSRLTNNCFWAGLAAFIFLIHPVQVESVAWISQRKNVLSMFFFLVSFWYYISDQHTTPGRRSRLLYVVSFCTFICALLTKSVTVVYSLVLILYDLCYGCEKMTGTKWFEKIPYLLATVAMVLITLYTQLPENSGGSTGFHGSSAYSTFITMLPVFVRYLGLVLWPTSLSAFYDPPIKTSIDVTVFLSMAVIVLMCLVYSALYKHRKDLFFWAMLLPVGLLPVSQIFPLVTLMNDRYLYFPMLGVAAAIAGIGSEIFELPYRSVKLMAIVLVSGLFLSLPVLTYQRIAVWQNASTLWADTLRNIPDSVSAANSLAESYMQRGKMSDVTSIYYLAQVYHSVGYDNRKDYLIKRAEFFYMRALTMEVGHAGAQTGLKLLRSDMGPQL